MNPARVGGSQLSKSAEVLRRGLKLIVVLASPQKKAPANASALQPNQKRYVSCRAGGSGLLRQDESLCADVKLSRMNLPVRAMKTIERLGAAGFLTV